MIDIDQEQLLTLSEAAQRLPGRPSVTTLWRWRKKGVNGKVLESVTMGGRIFTSIEAIQRFGVQSGDDPQPHAHRSPAARERAIDKAERELNDAGI